MPYGDIDRLLANRFFSGVTCTLETDAVSVIESPAIEAALERTMPDLRRAPAPLGAGIALAGRNRSLLWTPPSQVVFTAQLTGEYRQDVVRALGFGRDRLQQLARALRVGRPIRFAALILDVDFSSLELAPVGPFIASFVHPPGLNELVDGEWRVATRDRDRYFLNWVLSGYEMRQVRVEVRQLPLAADASAQVGPVVDKGLRLRVDANTKVNVVDGRAPIDVSDEDLERLRELVDLGVNEGMRFVREAAA